MNITYLLSVVSQVRYQKRVRALKRLGAHSNILAFERSYYPGKPWSEGYRSLGYIQHGNYFKRLPALLKAFSIVRSEAQASDVIYVFGLDTLLIACLAVWGHQKVALVYEVGDIRQILMGNGLTSRFLRWLERYSLRCVDLVVVTSEAYITGYFYGIQGARDVKYQVIENKLDGLDLSAIQDTNQFPKPYTGDILRIGYFGLIRCRHSWKVLKELVRRGDGRIQVYIRGIFRGLDDLEEEIRHTKFVEYGGPYVSPDDLPALYNQVDVVWVANYLYEGHLRWARTNRFYEACYFKRPMITQEGTQDGMVVDKLKLGKNIDLLNMEQAVKELMLIDKQAIDIWQRNLKQLPQSVYVYTDEHDKLMENLLMSL